MTEVGTRKMKIKKPLKWMLVRLPFLVVIAIAMMIATLKLVERYPQELRVGFEQFLSDSSGTNASIGKLSHVKFIPNFDLSAQDITMHDRNNAANISMEAKNIEMSAPIWSMFFGGSRINKLHVESLIADEGLMSPKSVQFDTVDIIDKNGPEQYGSFLIANGLYDGQKLSVEIEIKKLKNGYKVPKSFPFSVRIGSSKLNASLLKGFSKVWLKTVVFSKSGKVSAPRDYILVEAGEYNKNNPLSCLLYYADEKECDIYLEEKDAP